MSDFSRNLGRLSKRLSYTNTNKTIGINRVTDPTEAQDAATKNYVDENLADAVFNHDTSYLLDEDARKAYFSRFHVENDGGVWASADYTGKITWVQRTSGGFWNFTINNEDVAFDDFVFNTTAFTKLQVHNDSFIIEIDNTDFVQSTGGLDTRGIVYTPYQAVLDERTIFSYPPSRVTLLAGSFPSNSQIETQELRSIYAFTPIITETTERLSYADIVNGGTVGASGTNSNSESYITYTFEGTTYYRVFVSGGESIRTDFNDADTEVVGKTY